MVKELNQINVDTQRKKEEWNKKILELAAAQKEAYHKAYMSKRVLLKTDGLRVMQEKVC